MIMLKEQCDFVENELRSPYDKIMGDRLRQRRVKIKVFGLEQDKK